MTPATAMNAVTLMEPEFLRIFSFNPVVISTTAQMHIFSTVSNISPK